jgi:hypothetical protein
VTGELGPFEHEFVELTKRQFAFLSEAGFACEVRPAGNFELRVIYKSASVGLAVELVMEKSISVSVGPLRDGEFAAHFDEHLNEQLVDFYVDSYLREVDPNWRTPPLANALKSAEDMELVLQLYATALRAHGGPLLRGDQKIMDRGFANIRQGFIAHALENWAMFVNRVQTGYEGSIVDYTSALTERAQLESALRNWKGEKRSDPITQLARLDKIFDDNTEPLSLEAGSRWQIIPVPTAGRWWRKPKRVDGPLAKYFSERGG